MYFEGFLPPKIVSEIYDYCKEMKYYFQTYQDDKLYYEAYTDKTKGYEEGINMDEPDYKKAVENYEAGEDKGDAEAAYCLGKIYDEGRPGIQAVPIYAQLHYDNAANKGHKQAHARLNELLRD